MRFHIRDHALGDFIRLEAARRDAQTRPRLAKRLAIVVIEVPLATRRLALLHQHTRVLPHLAVEELHAELFAAFRMLLKHLPRAEKMPVRPHLKLHVRFARHSLDLACHAPFPRLDHDQLLRLQALDCLAELLREGLAPFPAELAIVHPPSTLFQRLAKMPHRREEDRDACLRAPHLRRLMLHLRHPDDILFRIKPIQRRRRSIELVTEDENKT